MNMSGKRTKIASILSFVGGIVSFTLGLMGITGFCCTVLGATILFYLGLASASSFIFYNAKFLIILGVVFLSISAIYYFRSKSNRKCSKKKQ